MIEEKDNGRRRYILLSNKQEKGCLNSCITLDINDDGFDEIICGWSTGKIQVRNEQNGDVLFELELGKEIAKVLLGDLNNSGKQQIICCTSNGEIYGYTYGIEEEKIIEKQTFVKDPKIDKEEINKLDKILHEKKTLMEEVENITIAISNKLKQNNPKDQNSLPSSTNVKIDLQSNNDDVI